MKAYLASLGGVIRTARAGQHVGFLGCRMEALVFERKDRIAGLWARVRQGILQGIHLHIYLFLHTYLFDNVRGDSRLESKHDNVRDGHDGEQFLIGARGRSKMDGRMLEFDCSGRCISHQLDI